MVLGNCPNCHGRLCLLRNFGSILKEALIINEKEIRKKRKDEKLPLGHEKIYCERGKKKRAEKIKMKTIQITDETYHDLLQIKADASLDGAKHVLTMDDTVRFLIMDKVSNDEADKM